MALTRSEGVGIAVALAAHAMLFAILSLNWQTQERHVDNPPMEVDIIADAAPESSAPVIAPVPPPPQRGDPDEATPAPPVVEAVPPAPQPPKPAPPRPTPPPTPPLPQRAVPPRPTPPRAQPRRPAPPRAQPRPVPTRTPPRVTPPPPKKADDADQSPRRRPDRPAPDASSRPSPPARSTPPRAAPAGRTPPTPTGRRPAGDPLGDIAESVSRNSPHTNPASQGAPAARTATEIRASIRTSINAEVARPWNACRVTGVDVDQLRTTIVFRLTQSGALDRVVSVTTTGVNASNRPQQARFEECARRAIDLAAPFNLPVENYSYWQTYTLDFQKRAR